MVILHNILANYTNRQLGINNRHKTKFAEHLSTGYKINRSADDAAGLFISEEMRGQIRGLTQGSRNIADGQNMINTAEGGINEQISIVQRMRELTIQAYNDTLTQDDRLNIQMEVDELCEEIDRIAAQTEFNTIKVLQGDRAVTQTVTITETTPARDRYLTINTVKEFPAWTGYDNELKLNGTNNQIDRSSLQDTSTYVRLDTYFVEDENNVITSHANAAYGPVGGGNRKLGQEYYAQDSKERLADGTAVYKGEWSPDIRDNYATSLNFQAIADCTDRDALIEKIGDLVGANISFHCGTCYKSYGKMGTTEIIAFESKDMRLDRDSLPKNHYARSIDLQGYLDQASQLLDRAGFDAIKANANLPKDLLHGYQTYDQYKNYVSQVSQGVASAIVGQILSKADFQDHFMRVVPDKSNKYQVDIYDFRDQDKIADAADGKVSGNAPMSYETIVTLPPDVHEYSFQKTSMEGYWIQMRANSYQGVELHFPNTSLDGLNLRDYTVFREGYCSLTSDKTYDKNFIEDAEALGNHRYCVITGGTPGTPGKKITEWHEREVTTKYRPLLRTIPKVYPPGYDKNGEFKPGYTKYIKEYGPEETKTETVKYCTTRWEGGTPGTPGKRTDFYAYPPDSLLRLDHALNQLTRSRSEMGAMYNRMGHAYLNDTNDIINLQTAESRIRDADIAEEMVSHSKADIIAQSAQAMLSQANHMADGVLKILGG